MGMHLRGHESRRGYLHGQRDGVWSTPELTGHRNLLRCAPAFGRKWIEYEICHGRNIHVRAPLARLRKKRPREPFPMASASTRI